MSLTFFYFLLMFIMFLAEDMAYKFFNYALKSPLYVIFSNLEKTCQFLLIPIYSLCIMDFHSPTDIKCSWLLIYRMLFDHLLSLLLTGQQISQNRGTPYKYVSTGRGIYINILKHDLYVWEIHECLDKG